MGKYKYKDINTNREISEHIPNDEELLTPERI